MARKGRDLEKLIANLEQSLAPKGAIINSPDFFEDIETGGQREVDVSIRYTVGSVPIIITVECRDRKSTDDCTWIEQLAQKQRSICVSRTVAVSSSGFSKPALNKAVKLGIETRTLKKLKPNDFEEILNKILLSIYHKKLTLTGGHLEFYYDDGPVNDISIEDLPHDGDFLLFRMFRASGGGIVLSLMDIAKETIAKQAAHDIENKKFNKPSHHDCLFNFSPGQLVANTNYGELSVKLIKLEYELIIEKLEIIPKEAVRYEQDDTAIVESMKLESNIENIPLNITINNKLK